MVGRATCCCRIDTCEIERAQVEFIDEDIDHTHWVFIGDVVVQALRQQCNLRSSLTFDESLHDCPHGHDDQKVRQPRAFSHSLDPLQPFEVSTKTRSIQFDIFRGAQDSFLGHLRTNSLTSVEASYLW